MVDKLNNDLLLVLARDAGLPVSWYERCLVEGKEPPMWRELHEFARLVLENEKFIRA